MPVSHGTNKEAACLKDTRYPVRVGRSPGQARSPPAVSSVPSIHGIVGTRCPSGLPSLHDISASSKENRPDFRDAVWEAPLAHSCRPGS